MTTNVIDIAKIFSNAKVETFVNPVASTGKVGTTGEPPVGPPNTGCP